MMVLIPNTTTSGFAWFFNKTSGIAIGSKRAVKIVGGRPLGTIAPSVFECVYNPLLSTCKVYECLLSLGVNVKPSTLTERIKAGNVAIADWHIICDDGTGSTQLKPVYKRITMTAYTPPLGVINMQTAQNVLFIRDAAAYTYYAGGDAFLWKAPTLAPGQHVLVSRRTGAAGTDLLAMHAEGACTMEVVTSVKALWPMATYIHDSPHPIPIVVSCGSKDPCDDLSGSGPSDIWSFCRRARRSERVSNLADLELGSEAHYQVTREEMYGLISVVMTAD